MIDQTESVLQRLRSHDGAPVGEHDHGAFLRWAAGADPEFGGEVPLSRYLVELRAGRPDLMDAFPQVPGHDVIAYREWARTLGVTQVPIPADFVPDDVPERTPGYQQPGVNLAGFLTAELGVGEVARRLSRALGVSSIPHANVGFDKTTNRTGIDFSAGDSARFDTNIVCVNADSWGAFAQHMGPSFFTGRHTIAVWFWETSAFPSMFAGASNGADEIWAASGYVADILRTALPPGVDVVQFPLPIVVPSVSTADPRPLVGAPANSRYLVTSFDYNSVVERKNPLGAIAAFTRAFADGAGPLLVVKSINGTAHPAAMARIEEAVGPRTDIIVHDGYLDAASNNALIAASSGLISLHRAEGFGFNIADAMALGVPVVVTDYSGSREFTSAADCWLVPATEVPVGPGQFPYSPDALWAAPDLDVAAEQLQTMLGDPERSDKLANAARARVLVDFTPERTGQFVRNRVAGIRTRRRAEIEALQAQAIAEAQPPTPRDRIRAAAARVRSQITRSAVRASV